MQSRDGGASCGAAEAVAVVVTPPDCPYDLAEAGSAWWAWAWRTPQAVRWDASATYTIARRAQLEDEFAALDFRDELEALDLFADGDEEAARRVEWALSALRRAAVGSVVLSKEMRELEAQLGLGPKAMAALGWKPNETTTDRLDDLTARRTARLGRSAS